MTPSQTSGEWRGRAGGTTCHLTAWRGLLFESDLMFALNLSLGHSVAGVTAKRAFGFGT